MSDRYYLVPAIGFGLSREDGIRPKYFSDLSGVSYRSQGYGHLACQLVASDPRQAEHDRIASRPDVYAFPDDLSSQIGPENVVSVVSGLERFEIPAGWVDEDMTYQDVLGMVTWIFGFVTRLHAWTAHAILRSIWTGSRRLSSIPGFSIDDLSRVGQSFGVEIGAETIGASATVGDLIGALVGIDKDGK